MIHRKFFDKITIGYSAVALLIPLYEFIIYPIIHRCIPAIKIYHKFIFGVTLQIATVTILMVFDSMAIKTHQGDSNNSTNHCILTDSHVEGSLNSNLASGSP